MRFFPILLIAVLFSSCTFFQKISGKKTAETEVVEVPTNLEGPAYDPATSPQVMTSSTALPVPAGSRMPPATTTEQPAAYGQVATPATTNNPVNTAPSTYSAPAAAPPATYSAKGEAAPASYGNATPMAPPTAESAALAATLNGLWVNAADANEVVEFTTDHYSTFYNGELLVQEPMNYHARCPGDCNGGQEMEIACFTISGPAGTDCYGILRMTTEVLEMSMLGVSTTPIVYRKK